MRLFHYFLGIEINELPNSVALLIQSKYIQDLFNKAKIEHCKPIGSLMLTSHMLLTIDGVSMQNSSFYRSVVAALQHITLIRFNITYVVKKTYQFMEHPIHMHQCDFKSILRYLQGIIQNGLVFKPFSQLVLTGFLMQNEALALIIVDQHLECVFFLVLILCIKALRSKVLFLNRAQRLSMGHWLMLLLKSFGLKLFFKNFKLHFLKCLFSGMIILA